MKPIRLFPELLNISDFIVKDIPTYHPDSRHYQQYWEEQERYCVEGKWGLDGDKWRYCPGNLYYYVNFTVIDVKEEKSKSRDLQRPTLRDIDWYIAYGWLCARGFSGFTDDEDYTCNYIVKKLEDKLPMTPSEMYTLKGVSHIRKLSGEYKKYIEPREYLYNKCNTAKGLPIYDNDAKNLFLLASRGLGKDLEENTLVYKDDGPIKIKDIAVGDNIFGADGKLTTVTSKINYYDQLQYEIEFDDGRKIECGEGHIWNVYEHGYEKPSNLELKSFKDDYLGYTRPNGRKDRKYFIKYCSPIEYPKRDLNIDPYFLGLWLGDGNSNKIAITTIDKEIKDTVYEYAEKFNYTVSINENSTKTCPTYAITNGRKKNVLKEEFINYNLFNNKHIPCQYLYNSIENRMELLKGLMDTDGSCYKNGGIEFSNSNLQLIEDFSKLLNSLGIKHKIVSRIPKYRYNGKLKNGKRNYRVSIRTDLKIFKLKRKLDNLVESTNTWTNSSRNRVGIKSITPTTIKPSICIGVDNKDNLFVAGDYIVTHNSYFTANAIIGHEFNFFGKKYYNEYLDAKVRGPEIVVGSALAAKSLDLLNKFKITQEYNKSNNGAWKSGSEFIPGFFYRNTEGTLVPNSKSIYAHEYKVKENGVEKTLGSGTNIKHVTYTTENPQAAVGTRPTVMAIEEVGLCFGKNTEIRLYNGSTKKIQDITTEDVIMGEDGSPRTIENLSNGQSELFLVEQNNGEDYVVSRDHVLYLEQISKVPSIKDDGIKKIFSQNFTEEKLGKYRLKTTYGIKNELLNFDKKDLKLHPYFLGLWLGDGCLHTTELAISSEKSSGILDWLLPYYNDNNCDLKKESSDRIIYIPKKRSGKTNFFAQKLKELGVWYNKFIPSEYLLSSEKDRLELLAGLIDTDGNICSKGKSNQSYEFNQTNRLELVDQVSFLAKSLGFRVQLRCRKINTGYANKILPEYRNKYILRISGDIWKIPVRIDYKKAIEISHKKNFNRSAIKVKSIGFGKFYGFKLKESPLFLLKDGTVVHNCENLIDVHASNEFCQFIDNKFGSSIYIGTGGNIDKIIGCKQVFENPTEYKMLEYTDLWEDRQTPIGMFIPAYYGNNIFLDENGNTDIEAAFAQEVHERKVRENAKNSMSLDNYKMGKPLVPSEMFLSRASFIFPTIPLRERELILDIKKEWEKNVSIGDLRWANKEKTYVIWEEDLSNSRQSKVITMLNTDNHKTDLSGKIAIYEHPDINTPEPNQVKSLYKIVYDPIKDEGGGTSLASVLVYKGFTEGFNFGLQNTIVAEWIGRYDQVNDAHDMAIKLAKYYNAKILFENNLPNFLVYCRDHGHYQMLQRAPWDAIKDSIKDPSRKYEVGVTMNNILSVHCEQLIRQWLLEPFLKTETKMLTNIDNLYSLRLIRELAAYTRDHNFDHISSFKLLVLWLVQDKKRMYTQEDLETYDTKNDMKGYRIQKLNNERDEYNNWYTY